MTPRLFTSIPDDAHERVGSVVSMGYEIMSQKGRQKWKMPLPV